MFTLLSDTLVNTNKKKQQQQMRDVSHPSVPQCQEETLEKQRLCGKYQRIPCPDLQFPFSQSSSLD